RRRACRSSWSSRSPVVALAGEAIELARFVRARRTTRGGISKALLAIANIARRLRRARHGGNRARTGIGFASAPNHRNQIGESRRNRRRRNRETLQTRQQQQTAD